MDAVSCTQDHHCMAVVLCAACHNMHKKSHHLSSMRLPLCYIHACPTTTRHHQPHRTTLNNHAKSVAPIKSLIRGILALERLGVTAQQRARGKQCESAHVAPIVARLLHARKSRRRAAACAHHVRAGTAPDSHHLVARRTRSAPTIQLAAHTALGHELPARDRQSKTAGAL